MFKPQLPQSMAGAIDRLGFGVVDKIIVDFGAAHGTSVDASTSGVSHFGPAGGSNAEQSRAAQTETPSASTEDDSMLPLNAKDALSYYLLWNREAQDFLPTTTSKARLGNSTAMHTSGRRAPLHEIEGLSENMNGLETRDSQGSSPAKKGAGDKTPETHVVTGPQQPGHAAEGAQSRSASDPMDQDAASTSGRQHDLPNWAHGAYSIRFAGSEFKKNGVSAEEPASKRFGVIWITGASAQDMEGESEANLQRCMAAVLQEFPALALPGQIKVFRSTWGSDSLFRGSYSFGSASAVGGECLALCEPLGAQNGSESPKNIKLLFAGEACHPVYYGCTHGAYLTGQSQARKLLASWTSSDSHL